MKKLLEAPSREHVGRLLPKRKREYFVHKCIKILAKRKRGNKFPMQGNRNFGQERVKGKAWNKIGNKSKAH